MRYQEINLEQGTPAWLEWRHDGIGASDAATIMGKNPFKRAEKLLYEKRHRINEPSTAVMAEGSRLEPEARRAYQKQIGIEVEPLCIESIEYPWLRASLDGISSQRDHMVEIKCGKSAMVQARRGKIPVYYYGQVQHQLMITGLEKIDYWCYRPESGGVLLQAERDDPYINELFKKELRFYSKMKKSVQEW